VVSGASLFLFAFWLVVRLRQDLSLPTAVAAGKFMAPSLSRFVADSIRMFRVVSSRSVSGVVFPPLVVRRSPLGNLHLQSKGFGPAGSVPSLFLF